MHPFAIKAFSFSALFIIALCIPFTILAKGDLVLLLQTWHTPLMDRAFIVFTSLGDGLVYIPLILIVSAYRYKYGIIALCVAVLHALVCVLLKQIMIPDALRPAAYFEAYQITLHQIPGVTLYKTHAFPSGHTATAFSIAVLLMVTFKKHWTIILFPVASCVGLSRIYIGQHFYADVVAGALIGSLSVFVVCRLLAYVRWAPWTEQGWLRQRLVTSPD